MTVNTLPVRCTHSRALLRAFCTPAQTIEEIDAHRQKEVLALVPYIIDAALRRDVPSVAAALVADLEENAAEERHKETEKTSRYTQTPMVDGTHGAGRCGGVRRAPADAGCPCAGSTRTPTTSRPFAMSSTSSTLGSRDSSRCSCFARVLYLCARHLHRG